jgi:putative ABC transport system permease protein
MTGFLQDIRYGLRLLRRSPGFAAAAMATLALGVGANTAIFSAVRAVLLKPLPFRNSSRLAFVTESVGGEPAAVSYPNYLDWRAQNRVFSEMAAFSDSDFILGGGDRPERVFGEVVTDTYFPLLGVRPLLGRVFLPEENRTPLAKPVALLGEDLWRRRYGADPFIVGRPVHINGAAYTVMGVMPARFRGFTDRADLWIPMMMRDAAWPQSAKFDFLHSRDIHWLRVLAALRPGVRPEGAAGELATIAGRLAAAYPDANRGRGAMVVAAHARYIRDSRAPLLVLFAAVGLILLIACANVANLVLSRAAGRQREVALRRALGAARGRLLRQNLTESLILSLAGSALGLTAAAAGLRFFGLILPIQLPSFSPLTVDGKVLLFAAALTTGTAIVLALVPLAESRGQVSAELLKSGLSATPGSGRRRLGGVLVGAEVGLAALLLVGAGLLLRSLARLTDADPGFRPDRLLTMRFYVPDRAFPGDGRNRFGPDLARRISEVPGVESAAVTMIEPFAWGGIQRGFNVEGHAPISNAEADTVYYQEVGPGYFSTMGIPLRRGRDFTPRDDRRSPGAVLVSEAFARRYWPGEDPIGRRIRFGSDSSPQAWLTVVGVAGNVKFTSLRQDASAEPVIYGALLQSEVIINLNLVVRTRTAPGGMVGPVRDAIQRFDAGIPVYDISTMDDMIAGTAGSTRTFARLLAGLAGVALLLCGIGIAGVIGYSVARRTREIGIRMALGATRDDVLRLVVGESVRRAGAGLAAGLLGAAFLTRLVRGLLFGVAPIDAATFAGTAALIGAIALAAAYLPARRASRIEPLAALREE